MRVIGAIGSYGLIAIAFALVMLTFAEVVVWP